MATQTITATNLKQGMYYSYNIQEPTSSYAVSTNLSAGSFSSHHYVLKFTIPKFSGKSTKITIKLTYFSNVAFDSQTVNCILATSPSNFGSYSSSSALPSDPYRIGSTSCTVKKSSSTFSFSFSTNNIKSEQTYYIMVYTMQWIVQIKSVTQHLITLTYNPINSITYIDNGTAFEIYECYIDNGSTWEQYKPYIDSGTAFEAYG